LAKLITGWFVAVLAFGTVLTGPAWSQTIINGRIGADLGNFNFTNFLVEESSGYDVNRRLSNQFIDMAIGGPLVNGYFANYGVNFRVSGTQIRSVTDGENMNEFINPDLTNYYGSVAIFPERRFPVGFHIGRTENYSIRYEVNNKGEVDIVDPGLTVLRRYQTITEGIGGDVAYAASPGLEFFGKYEDSKSQLIRQYDFDENKNIWVDFSVLNPGQGPFYEIAVVNTIPDRDVLLFIDEAFVDTIPADSTVPVIVEGGKRRLEFAPIGLNSFRTTLEISANMVWRIYFSNPPGGTDTDSAEKKIIAGASFDRGGHFSNQFTLDATDGRDEVQDIDSSLMTISNQARYLLSLNSSLGMKTTLVVNDQSVANLSNRKNKTLTNQTSATWNRPYGVQTRLTHRFIQMNSDQDGKLTKSTGNVLDGSVTFPTHWHDHEAIVRLNTDFLSDNIESGHKTYQGILNNFLRLRKVGFLWTPNHELRAVKGWNEKSDSKSKELESRFSLKGERRNWGKVGDLMIKGDYTWRKLTNEVRENTKVSMGANAFLNRSFGMNYILTLRGGVKVEEFEANFIDDNNTGNAPSPQDDTKSLDFGLVLTMKPVDSVSILAMMGQTKSNEADNIIVTGSVNWTLPWINSPLRARISQSERTQEGRPPQKDIRAKVSFTQNIRKIKMALAYNYLDSDGPAEHYNYNEFTITVTRDFDVK